jgi:outer membrane cobalamin receptor
LLAAGVVSAVADDKAKTTKKKQSGPPEAVAAAQKRASTKTKVEPKQVITGSHIPTKLKRYGRTADTVSLVYILDREDLERSGAASVGSALRRLPFTH